MATSNISNTILDLSGSAVSDVVVVARLKPGPGFRIYEGTEVASQITTTSASTGAWSLTLEQNEPADPVDATKLGISPSGSYYEIEEQIPDAKGGLKSWTVTVGTVSQTLYAALVTTLPADVGPTYLTQTSGDARYSQLGNIGSTSTTAVAATASQGTASSAARSDHIHNLGSIVDSSTVELSSGLIRVKDSGITTAKINNGAVTTLKTDISFATTAARDAAITSPVAGMTAYINSGDSSEGLYSYTGTTWNKGPSWNAPWGLLASGVSSGNTVIGALQDLTGMTATATFIANRNIELRAQIQWSTTNMATPNYISYIYEGATGLTGVHVSLAANNAFGWQQIVVHSYWLNPTAGSHTYNVKGSAYPAAGATGIVTATVSNFRIIDHGPSGAPN